MADDWDDWGDDDDKSVTGDASNCSEKSEGWDWPGTSAEKDSATAATTAERVAPNDPDSKSTRLAEAEEREAREEAVGEMAENYFAELQRYLEDLADPSVREEINQVCTCVCLHTVYNAFEPAVCFHACGNKLHFGLESVPLSSSRVRGASTERQSEAVARATSECTRAAAMRCNFCDAFVAWGTSSKPHRHVGVKHVWMPQIQSRAAPFLRVLLYDILRLLAYCGCSSTQSSLLTTAFLGVA